MSWDVLYRIGLRLGQLEQWPNSDHAGIAEAPFKASITDTTKMLANELNKLGSRKAVLQLLISEQDLRQDGLPLSTAKLEYPGVILSIDAKYGVLRFCFNRFSDWKDNLCAIALALENLRKAGLHGVGKDGEHYRGWIYTDDGRSSRHESQNFNKKTARTKRTSSPLEQAISFLSKHSDIEVTRETVKLAYRKCAQQLHPDIGTGSHDLFISLQKAREVAYKHWHLKV